MTEVELPLEGLIGRDRELAELLDLLQSARFVTITGLGGTGKTRLARAIASSWPRTGGEVVWVDLAAASDPAVMSATIADALGVSEQPDRPTIEALTARLLGWTGLIVLDNLEQLVSSVPEAVRKDTVEAVRRIAHSSEHLSLLATSRVLVGVAGEAAFPLGALDVGGGDFVSTLESPGPALFVREARRVGGLRRSDPVDQASVLRICRAVGGLPLAIELAAARTRVLSLEAIAEGLEDRRSRSPASGPLRSILEWTTGQLAPIELDRLRILAFFPAEFTLQEAAVAWGAEDAADGIDHLVQLGLAVRVEPDRFGLPVPVRQWATADWQVPKDVYARIAAYVAGRGVGTRVDLVGPRAVEAISALRHLEPLLRAVLDIAVDADPDLAAEVIGAFDRYWFRADRVREIRDRCTVLLEREVSLASRAILLSNAAEAELAVSGPAMALPIAHAALAAAQDAASDSAEQTALLQIGRLLMGLARFADASQAMNSALAIARARGDRQGTMTILGNLATVSVAEASEAAAEQFDEAATLARDLGDRFSLSMILANSLLTIGRDDPRAMSRMEEALAIQRDLGPSQYLVWMELSAIEILLVAGRSDDAANRLAAIIDLVRGFGTWQERAQTASVVACLLHARGRDMLAAVALGIWDQTWRDARDGETRQNDPTGDPWLDSVIDRIQRTLGPVRFDAEHARGRAIESAVALDRLVELIALPAAEVTPGDGPFGRLSARELEVFELVGRGQTDPEIAHALSISAKTVSVHVANIKAKIGAEARIDVAMAARTRETNTG